MGFRKSLIIIHIRGLMAKLTSLFYRLLVSRVLLSITFNAFVIFFLWIIVTIYNSVFFAGMLATIYLVTSLSLSLPIGHMIDRMNSTLVGIIGTLIGVSSVIVLLFGYSLIFIYLSMALLTLGVTMKGDSFSATIKKHLDEKQFHEANSYVQGAVYASNLIGTALGGACILYFKEYFPLILILIACASPITSSISHEDASSSGERKGMREMSSAIYFYRKILGFLIVGFALNGLFESIDVYSSGLFYMVLKSTALYYTIFVASVSVGGILGSAISKMFPASGKSGLRISIFVLGFSPILVTLSISRMAVIDIAMAFALGVILPIINIPLNAKLMSVVPKDIYGKVMAFLRVFISGSTPLMAAIFSFVSIYAPVNIMFLYIGLTMLPITLLSFIVIPKFMAMEA